MENGRGTYQFRITLKNIKPPIWRRIQVPEDYTFWALHCAIQDAMGWEDYHLHCFEFAQAGERIGIRIGIPDEEAGPWNDDVFPGWKVKIKEWFKKEGDRCRYDYDFGDGWQHVVLFEKIVSLEQGVKYPRCIAGKRACPPEDCGGPSGYEDFLKAIADPRHPEHKEMKEWIGEPFAPERFDPDDVAFFDPAKRLRDLMKLDSHISSSGSDVSETDAGYPLLRDIKERTLPRSGVWELDYGSGPHPGILFLAVARDSFFIIVAHAEPVADIGAFAKSFLEGILKVGALPDEIVVTKNDFAVGFRLLAESLGFRITIAKKFKAIPEVRKSMTRFLKRQEPFAH